jgi:hypothetical protein
MVANFTVQVFGDANMARYKARFRFSIKDHATGKKLKIESLLRVSGSNSGNSLGWT